MKTLLLNPGPVTLTERVRRSLLQPDLCHRESEFYDLQDEARSRLLDVYGLDSANWSAVLMTASGTGLLQVGEHIYENIILSSRECGSQEGGRFPRLGSRADAESHMAAPDRAILRLLTNQRRHS